MSSKQVIVFKKNFKVQAAHSRSFATFNFSLAQLQIQGNWNWSTRHLVILTWVKNSMCLSSCVSQQTQKYSECQCNYVKPSSDSFSCHKRNRCHRSSFCLQKHHTCTGAFVLHFKYSGCLTNQILLNNIFCLGAFSQTCSTNLSIYVKAKWSLNTSLLQHKLFISYCPGNKSFSP